MRQKAGHSGLHSQGRGAPAVYRTGVADRGVTAEAAGLGLTRTAPEGFDLVTRDTIALVEELNDMGYVIGFGSVVIEPDGLVAFWIEGDGSTFVKDLDRLGFSHHSSSAHPERLAIPSCPGTDTTQIVTAPNDTFPCGHRAGFGGMGGRAHLR